MCEDEDGEFHLDFVILIMDELDAEDRGSLGLPGESGLVCPVNKDDVTPCIEVWYGDSAASGTWHIRETLFTISHRSNQG